LKEPVKEELLVTERKILRRIFGPTKERDGTWRIKTNDELNNLIKNEDIINYIAAQRLGWFGRVYRMAKNVGWSEKYMKGNRCDKTNRKTRNWMEKR
jgi:hypothetical protein